MPEPHDPRSSLALLEPSEEAQVDELLERWRFANLLGRLPDEQADLLRRRFYEGATQTEIAAATGVPLGTVKMRMVQGLARLRDLLDGEERTRMNERLFDYLLDELAPDERAAFEADPARVAEAERLRPIVTRLESLEREQWDPPEAPALVLPRAPEPRREPRPAPRRRRVLSLTPRLAAGLAVLLLAIGVGAGLLLNGRDGGGGTDRGRRARTRPRRAGRRLRARHRHHPGPRRAREIQSCEGLKPSANGDFYELWLMNSADDLVSLGSFRVPASGEADVTVPLPADPDGFAALDISAEPADGNPAHSGALGAARTAEDELGVLAQSPTHHLPCNERRPPVG